MTKEDATMTDMLSNYLDQVDRDLGSLALSERTALLKDLRADLLERIAAGESPQQALEHLGEPEHLRLDHLCLLPGHDHPGPGQGNP
jgi:uncharacterized membrane protein